MHVEILDLLEVQEMPDVPVNVVLSASLGFPVVLESLERLVPEALMVTLDFLGSLAREDCLVPREVPARQDSLDSKENVVIQVRRDLPDNEDNQDLWDREDLWVSPVIVLIILVI